MTRLVQLKNGDWIDPATVTSIRVLDVHEGTTSESHSPRMVVRCGHHEFARIEYPTLEEACKARDELAAIVNAACHVDFTSSPGWPGHMRTNP